MKKSSLIAVFFVLCLGTFTILAPLSANADLFQIISTEQSISGFASSASDVFDDEGNHDYSYSSDSFGDWSSSPTSLSGSVSTSGSYGGSYASASSSLSTDENGFSAFVEGYAFGRSMMGVIGDVDAFSSVDIIFRVNELSKWWFSPYFDPNNWVAYISLVDLETGNTLFNIYDNTMGDYELTLNPQKNYQLVMFGDAVNSYYAAYLDASASPVPEPTTMLLLALGLMGLAGMRKKFKK